MKEDFYKELKKKPNSETYLRAADKIKCFKCLDIGLVWRNRGAGSFMDFRGAYDFIHCSGCTGNEYWDRCSSNNDTKFNGIRICHKNANTREKINNFLEKDFSVERQEIERKQRQERERIKLEEERRYQEEKERKRLEEERRYKEEREHQEKESRYQELLDKYEKIQQEKLKYKMKVMDYKIDNINNKDDEIAQWNGLEYEDVNENVSGKSIEIAIEKLANIVEVMVKAYVGDIPGAVSQCKNVTISLCSGTSNKEKTISKIIKDKDNERNNIYILLTLTQKQSTEKKWTYTNYYIELTGKMCIMMPLNEKAEEKCLNMIKQKADNFFETIRDINMFKSETE